MARNAVVVDEDEDDDDENRGRLIQRKGGAGVLGFITHSLCEQQYSGVVGWLDRWLVGWMDRSIDRWMLRLGPRSVWSDQVCGCAVRWSMVACATTVRYLLPPRDGARARFGSHGSILRCGAVRCYATLRCGAILRWCGVQNKVVYMVRTHRATASLLIPS